MSTERRRREGMVDENGEQDPLVKALNDALYKCCDELGIIGCACCPVERKCHGLCRVVVEAAGNRHLRLAEYRYLTRKFDCLKQERDSILIKKTAVLLTAHKTAENTLSHR